MKHHTLHTLINEVTPRKENSFCLIMDTLFNVYKEVNESMDESAVAPVDVDDLGFEEWFSWN